MATTVVPFPVSTSSVAHDLTGRATLVDLTIRRWEAKVSDPQVVADVSQRAGADPEMGVYKRYLIAPARLERGRKIADRIGAEHRRRTLPWQDGRTRVLSNTGYWDYRQAMDNLLTEYRDWTAHTFVPNYPSYVQESKGKLGKLWRPGEYPSQQRVAGLFSASYRMIPFATVDDFRIDLSAAELARLRDEYEQDTAQSLDKSMQTVWERLYEEVSHLAERVTAYDPNGTKVTGVFRDSLIDNVRNVVDILPSLNITNNPALTRITQEARARLLRHTAQELRDDPGARVETAAAADDILAKMRDFVSIPA